MCVCCAVTEVLPESRVALQESSAVVGLKTVMFGVVLLAIGTGVSAISEVEH